MTMTPWQRLAYDLGQASRLAWYGGHAWFAQRMTPPLLDAPPAAPPDRRVFLAELVKLLQRERAQIAAGRYRMPAAAIPPPRQALRQSQRFLGDLGPSLLRRRRGAHQEVFHRPPGEGRRYPRYYVQNFHYQTDGYLSEHSAALYDFQVEVLFNGAADVMRRQALPPVLDALAGRPLAGQRLLDVACGTGRLLGFIKANRPRLPVVGLDLSRPYLAAAQAHLRPWSWTRLVEGAAERLPFADGSFAVVTCVYLFHELPRAVRHQVAAELARVLQPGGRLVLVDSLQLGDNPPLNGMLELFPELYHEPYYRDFIAQDLHALLGEVGLVVQTSENAFLSKVLVADKAP